MTKFVLSEMGKWGRGGYLSCNLELATEIIPKSFALSDKDGIIPGPFMITGTNVLSLLRIL